MIYLLPVKETLTG